MAELPSRVEERSFADIHREFAESEYGETLSSEIRYDRYRPVHVDTETWIEILGADVNGLKHMPVTYGLTRIFLRDQSGNEQAGSGIVFSRDEERTLLLAAQIHDWQEAIVGDINYELKTIDEKKNEQEIFCELFDHFFDTERPQHKNIKLAVESAIFDESTKTGRAFNAVERLGYVRTALRSFYASRETDDQTLSQHLEWLTAGVLSNQIAALVEYENDYPFVSRFLTENEDSISAAYEALSVDVFLRHGQTETSRHEAYRYSQRIWENRKDNNNQVGSMKREAYDRGVFGSGPNLDRRFVPSHEELQKQVEACRTLGLKIVLTSGSFDLKHVGHERYLYLAHTYGDILVVGVDSDKKIQKRKGEHRPVNPEEERLESLVHLRYVDFVTLKQADDPKWHLIKTVKPDTLILTQETYDREDIEALKEFCGRIEVLPPQATTSTSAKIGRFMKARSETVDSELREAIAEWVEAGDISEEFAIKMGRQLVGIVERMIRDA